ncbi:MAG: hypothetical protein K0U47_06685 [Epsilonproteobacteria bacterium]|nr:hypothetical protein [Campylobacterota bacterium]
MYLFLSIISVFFLSTTLYAYQDFDIDGVDDKIDECPNTPFDQLVDKNGCPLEEGIKGKLTLKFGTDISFDDLSDKTSSFNLFASYTLSDFTAVLSNYSYYESYQNSLSGVGDIYASGGYHIRKDDLHTFVSVGIKIPSEDVGTGEQDYFVSLYTDYFLDERKDLFFYGGYTFSGDSHEVDYENFATFSVGGGYAFNSRYYSALSFDYSQSAYSDTEAYQALSWFHSYAFSKRYFTTLNYTYSLDDRSLRHAISLKFGVNFD